MHPGFLNTGTRVVIIIMVYIKYQNKLTPYHTIPFENIVENTGNQHFLTMFSILSKTEFINLATFILSFANALKLYESKILLIGKELTHAPCKVGGGGGGNAAS